MTRPASREEFLNLVSGLSEEDQGKILKFGLFLLNGPRKMQARVKNMVNAVSEAPNASEARARIETVMEYIESA